MRTRLLVAAGIVLAVAAVALSAGGAYAYFWESGRSDVIAAGVSVAGIDVGNLRADAAGAALESRIAAPLRAPILLRSGGHTFRIDPTRLGLRVDVPAMVSLAVQESRRGGLAHRFLRDLEGRRVGVSIPLEATWSGPLVQQTVENVASVLDRPARSARVVASATSLHIVPAEQGLAVDQDTLRAALTAALLRPTARTIAVPTRPVEARWTRLSLARRYPSYLLIDRETFTLRLYRHLKLAKRYSIAVGQAGLETPAGLYRINDKQINPSWHVPNSAWAGGLAGRIIPPGPSDPIKARWMGFWNGAGIHGTDEDWSIGHAVSHGCVRMHIPDVEQLYPLVPLGTPIYVG
jgi:L,D-transpeptidase catalytic domain/Putative peptidoglycan binding domain